MKKILFSAMFLLGAMTLPMNASDFAPTQEIVSQFSDGTYTGTLETLMGTSESTHENFSLTYNNGYLQMGPFQIGKMPGTITVAATGLSLGTTVKCNESVILTIGGVPTTYNANITVSEVGGKLHVEIDVLNPIYEGLPFVAEVEFTEY